MLFSLLKRVLLFLIVGIVWVVYPVRSSAQVPADTALWQSELEGRLSGSQAAYVNWQEGGSGLVNFTSAIEGFAERTGAGWQLRHELDLAFGLVRQDAPDFRKSTDQLLYNVSLQFQGDANIDPTVAMEFRSQFAPGFNYKKNPFPVDRVLPVKVSDLLSPAYITESFGLTYDPGGGFSTRLGLAGKETIVIIPRLRQLYKPDETRAVSVQLGAESHTDISTRIAENIRLESTLSLFAAYNQAELPDMRWSNKITMKVNSWFNVQINGVVFYDRDVSPYPQIKETLSLGVYFSMI